MIQSGQVGRPGRLDARNAKAVGGTVKRAAMRPEGGYIVRPRCIKGLCRGYPRWQAMPAPTALAGPCATRWRFGGCIERVTVAVANFRRIGESQRFSPAKFATLNVRLRTYTLRFVFATLHVRFRAIAHKPQGDVPVKRFISPSD